MFVNVDVQIFSLYIDTSWWWFRCRNMYGISMMDRIVFIFNEKYFWVKFREKTIHFGITLIKPNLNFARSYPATLNWIDLLVWLLELLWWFNYTSATCVTVLTFSIVFVKFISTSRLTHNHTHKHTSFTIKAYHVLMLIWLYSVAVLCTCVPCAQLEWHQFKLKQIFDQFTKNRHRKKTLPLKYPLDH